jgi:hypothetical protein
MIDRNREKKPVPSMKPPGCVWVGAPRESVLFSEVPAQGKYPKLNRGCLGGLSSWSANLPFPFVVGIMSAIHSPHLL